MAKLLAKQNWDILKIGKLKKYINLIDIQRSLWLISKEIWPYNGGGLIPEFTFDYTELKTFYEINHENQQFYQQIISMFLIKIVDL